jgi:hypothetical protein
MKETKFVFCETGMLSKSIQTPVPPRDFSNDIVFWIKLFFADVEDKKVECDEKSVAQKDIFTPLFLAAVTAGLVLQANETLLFAPVDGLMV